MPIENINQKRKELIIKMIEEAGKTGDFKTRILLAERLDFYFYAGEVSIQHGLIKRAYKNFKKESEKRTRNEMLYNESLENIEKMLFFRKSLTKKEIEENEYYYGLGNLEIINEYDLGNKNKRIENKIHENIRKDIEKYKKGNEFSCEKIRIYN